MSSFTELDAFTDNLTEYLDLLSENYNDPTQTLPMFEDYIGNLNFDVLITEAQLGANGTANYTTGALVDTVHFIAAVLREFNLRSKSKGQYFVDGQDDIDRTADFLDYMNGLYTNFFKGKSPIQAKSD